MGLGIRNHIQLNGDNPLDAVVAGTQHKAYLVANLALKDSSQVAADHYNLHIASVHGAIAFFYDHEQAIEQAIHAARDLGESLGARSGQTALDAIKKRGNAS